jgi:hypothetical protein
VDRKKVVPALRVGHDGGPRRLASSAGGRHRRLGLFRGMGSSELL